jgi:hypothetical protein
MAGGTQFQQFGGHELSKVQSSRCKGRRAFANTNRDMLGMLCHGACRHVVPLSLISVHGQNIAAMSENVIQSLSAALLVGQLHYQAKQTHDGALNDTSRLRA